MKRQFFKRFSAALCAGTMLCMPCGVKVSAEGEIAHDPSRNVQAEGVGNPFGFGERMAPEGTSVSDRTAAK